jgi:ACR3 family arsenite transporter
LDPPARPPRVPDRAHHRRPRPLHRHGPHLERPRLWQPGTCRRARRHQFGVSVAYSLLGYFYLELLPGWLGLDSDGIDVTVRDITKSVLIFLGIPLLAGFLTRLIGEARRGTAWYENTFLPRIGPIALYGLLFTIVILFALQGDAITDAPLDVARIAVPLLVYFALMWTGAFAAGLRTGLDYERNTSIAFTAAGNNFELAIAVAIGVFGVTSGQALAGVVGPLIEVPALVGLVYISLWAQHRYYPDPPTTPLDEAP